jgi:hypothetical protein
VNINMKISIRDKQQMVDIVDILREIEDAKE